MRFGHLCGLAVLALGFAFTYDAQAALQVTLGEVNTSVGVKPTSTKNKWALQTDPEINASSAGPNLDDYIPFQGSLCDSYDPTKFQLDTNPTTGQYDLGDTVQGMGPYEVFGFDVLMNGGGVVDVHANPLGGPDLINLIGNTTGGEAGEVLNIQYELIPDRTNQAAPVDTDQFFYQINLTQIQDVTPDDGVSPLASAFDPGVVTAFGNVNSFLTINTTNPNSGGLPSYTTTFSATGFNGGPNFIPSTNAVPEPTTLSLLAIGILSLATRRNRGQ
jgi:PEP-CTERM motif